MKKGFVDEAAVIVAGVMVLSVFLLFVLYAAITEDTAARHAPPRETIRFRTVTYDGHWLIVPNGAGGALHHPDCPVCAPAERKTFKNDVSHKL